MQLYYVLAGIYGWVVWYNSPQRKESATRTIGHTPHRWWPTLIAVYGAIHAVLYLVLQHLTDSTVPFWDAMTTALSVVAMWMLARKRVEQWLIWGIVDLITVGLYLYKGIPITAGLYALYTVLAVVGWRRWCRLAKQQ